MKKRMVLVTLAWVLATATAHATGVLKLPLEAPLSDKPTVINLPDGTKIEWQEFYRSAASSVAVGRSRIDGPLMPASNLDYSDCFLIARGTATFIVGEKDPKTYHVHAGQLMLLPRGVRIEGRDFKDYVHFAASFETQADAKSNGPAELRLLEPNALKKSDFRVEGDNMRHVYYEGVGGVAVRAWQATTEDFSTGFFSSPWSELTFITAGTGTVTNEDGSTVPLKAGDTIFIAKGQRLKLSTHGLRKLGVIFDQQAGPRAAEK